MPVVVLPDLRFEEGLMLSIKPFLHPLNELAEEEGQGERDELGEMVREGVKVEWGNVTYVLIRDQVRWTR